MERIRGKKTAPFNLTPAKQDAHIRDLEGRARGSQFKVIEARAPLEVSPGAPSLNKLGNDIVVMILDLIRDASPPTIFSFALVSSYYYRLARYSQHREVTIDISGKDGNARDRLHFIEKAGFSPAIRRLVVQGDGQDRRIVNHLCRLLPSMTGMTDIEWHSSGIPSTVITALGETPSVRLHTATWDGYRIDEDESNDVARLEGNANLHSLKVSVNYYGAKDCLEVTQPLKRILLSCPNVRVLNLNIGLPSTGCVIYGPPAEYCGFGFVDGERPPALEELELHDYPFGYEGRSPQSDDPLIGLRQRGYPLKGTEKDYWAQNFDWSQLKRLTTPLMDFALMIMPKLRSLQEVSFPRAWDTGSVKTFYENVPAALESITVTTVESIGLEALLRHGPKLRKLQIHQDETWSESWREATADVDTLRRIRDGCPHIEELGVDVGRSGVWPYDILDVLASFPRLRSLTIWFELGMGYTEKPITPYTTFSSAELLFQYLLDHPSQEFPRLQQLEVVSGSPPPLGHGLLSQEAFWPAHNSTRFVCRLSERDDEATEKVFITSCPSLDYKTNGILRMKDYSQTYTGNQYFRVARDGPTPIGKWRGHW